MEGGPGPFKRPAASSGGKENMPLIDLVDDAGAGIEDWRGRYEMYTNLWPTGSRNPTW